MPESIGMKCLGQTPGELMHNYNWLQDMTSNLKDGPEKDLAIVHTRIIRGIILARLLDLKPPFEVGALVYADEVTIPVNSLSSVQGLHLWQTDQVADFTYDTKYGWLIILESQNKLHLFKASDFKKENHLSRHALASHESRI